jgi:hypothetical protein
MPTLNINFDAVIKHTARLEKLKRSALPSAARGALNDAAFHVKQQTLPKEFNNAFVKRAPGFVRAFSQVDKASGFKMSNMRATVGMVDRKKGGRKEDAGENMTPRQISGSRIDDREFMPTDEARVGKNPMKKIQAKYRLSGDMGNRLKNVVDTARNRASSRTQRFVRTAIHARSKHGNGALIRHKTRTGVTKIYEVGSGGRPVKNRTFQIRVKAVYTYEKNRVVPAGRTKPFTRIAAKKSSRHLSRFYMQQAQKRINWSKK